MAIVSAAPTQRSVTGSIANTSNGVVSSTRYSPGLVARSRPYGVSGRLAADLLVLVPPNAPVPRERARSSRRPTVVPGMRTDTADSSASNLALIVASTTSCVGRLLSVYSPNTARAIASHCASAPASSSCRRDHRPSSSAAGPDALNSFSHARTVDSATPSSAALAAYRLLQPRSGSNCGRGSPGKASSRCPRRNPVRSSCMCATRSCSSALASFDRLLRSAPTPSAGSRSSASINCVVGAASNCPKATCRTAPAASRSRTTGASSSTTSHSPPSYRSRTPVVITLRCLDMSHRQFAISVETTVQVGGEPPLPQQPDDRGLGEPGFDRALQFQKKILDRHPAGTDSQHLGQRRLRNQPGTALPGQQPHIRQQDRIIP